MPLAGLLTRSGGAALCREHHHRVSAGGGRGSVAAPLHQGGAVLALGGRDQPHRRRLCDPADRADTAIAAGPRLSRECRCAPRSAVGCCQILAMIPGVSRAGATIMGGLMLGVSRPAATEFSFFLAIPTMFGAAFYDLYKSRGEPVLRQRRGHRDRVCRRVFRRAVRRALARRFRREARFRGLRLVSHRPRDDCVDRAVVRRRLINTAGERVAAPRSARSCAVRTSGNPRCSC